MTLHNALTGVELHEPKNMSAATAGAADIGKVVVSKGDGTTEVRKLVAGELDQESAVAGGQYVSDGAGGGDWIRVQGWGQYQDTERAVGTPTQVLTAGVRTKMLIDGGFQTLEKLPSDAVAPLWDVATSKLTPIAAFDTYHIRLDAICENYGGTDPYIVLELDIGGALGTIYSRDLSLHKAGAANNISLGYPVFTGATFVANGGTIYVTYQGTGTCDLYANSILIIREAKNYI